MVNGKRRSLLVGCATASMVAPGFLRHARASSKVRVGIPLPLTSVQGEVAAELQLGYELALQRARRLGGVEIEPLWADDKSVPESTALAVERFGKDPGVLAVSGIVGTPHAKAALPAAVSSGLPIVGLRSGAAELRDGRRGVYHLRASFADELTMMVRMISSIGGLKLAVVFSDDAFGRGSLGHVQTVAAARGLQLGKIVAADRNGADIEEKVSAALAPAEGTGALLMLMISAPMLKGLRHAREKLNFVSPVFAMSFCATRYLAESRDAYLTGLGLVTAFPLPRISHGNGFGGLFQVEAANAGKQGAINSLTAFEGFIYGTVLASAINKAQGQSREALVKALASSIAINGERVAFDGLNVGYHYLKVIHKGANGPLRG